MPPSFERQLDRLGRRLRRLAWTFGLCRTAAVAGMLFAFLAALDVALRFDPPILRAGLLAVWAVTVGAIAYESLLRRLCLLPGPSDLAEKLERRFEPLRGKLAAAVEFSGADTAAVQDSASLRQAVVKEAEVASDGADFGEVVDPSSARQAAVHAGFAAAILIALATVFPSVSRTAAIRFFAPFSPADYRVEDDGSAGVPMAPRPPEIRLDRVEVKSPSYASTAEITPERIRAVAGSRITLFGSSDRPVASVEIEEEPDAEIAVDGSRFSASWELLRGGAVHVRVSDAGGLVGEAVSREFYVVEDRPPVVRMTRPTEGLAVAPEAVLQVDAIVRDDFGIAAVEAIVAKKDAVTGAIVEHSVSVFRAEPGASFRKRVSIETAEVPLAPLAPKPGEEATIWIRAADLKGETATGPRRRIAIVSMEEAAELLAARRRELTELLARLLTQQEACSKQTSTLSADWKTPASAELTARLETLVSEQSQLAIALRDPNTGVFSRFSRLLDAARADGASAEAVEVLDAVNSWFIRPAAPLLGGIERDLRRAVRDPSATLDDAVKGQTELGERWEKALYLLQRQEEFFDLGAALAELVRSEEELRARLGMLLPKARGMTWEELPAVLRTDLEAESEKQRTLGEKWVRLASRLDEDETLRDVVDATVSAKMDDAVKAIADNRLKGAIESLDAVVLALREIRKRLGRAMEQEAEQAATEAAESERANGSETEGTSSEGPAEGASDEATSGGDPSAPPKASKGPIDVAAVRRAAQLMEGLWGMLPPRERAAVRQLPLDAFPPEYAPLIEAYYRELSRSNGDGTQE